MTEPYSLGKHDETVEAALTKAEAESWTQRIWAKDVSLWKSHPEHTKIILNSLGWLTVAEELASKTAELKVFTNGVLQEGFTGA